VLAERLRRAGGRNFAARRQDGVSRSGGLESSTAGAAAGSLDDSVFCGQDTIERTRRARESLAIREK
jgi:hypothetical protein